MSFNSRRPPTDGPAGVRRGFSLIEVMVAVVIIGILASVVVINVRSRLDTARRNKALSDISTLVSEVQSFYLDRGRYPTTDEGVKALGIQVPKDPWGTAYQYLSPGKEGDFEIISYGGDRRPGGEKTDADITSDNLQAGGGSEDR